MAKSKTLKIGLKLRIFGSTTPSHYTISSSVGSLKSALSVDREMPSFWHFLKSHFPAERAHNHAAGFPQFDNFRPPLHPFLSVIGLEVMKSRVSNIIIAPVFLAIYGGFKSV